MSKSDPTNLENHLNCLRSDLNSVLLKLNSLSFGTTPVVQEGDAPRGTLGLNLIDIEKLTTTLENTIQNNLNSKSVTQTYEFFAREVGNAKFFNLTQMIFRISSQMTNSIADLAKFHPNFKELRKEIIK